ncbi:MAG: beta-glucosidase [Opitutus sp.]|nr:beta-glucosidase [Opitutus sp.]
MNRFFLAGLCVVGSGGSFLRAAELPAYRRAELPIAARVADLLGRMTLEEKIDQLHQSGIGDTNPNNLQERRDAYLPTYGSFIIAGPPATVLATRNALQKRALEESRLGIPVLFAGDVIHGYRTILPIPLAQAGAWDTDLVRRGAALAAAEARAHGIDWTYAPMVDHSVDARWGRIAETFGESPHASSAFAVASVQGFQGSDLTRPDTVAATLKHYVGYGASEGGRDYSATWVAPQELWERHLPPFEAGVRAGARGVMSAFNDLNGIPTTANRHTLDEILRQRWGFDGVVVSDWAAVRQLIIQGYAADEAEATQRALAAGVDIDMSDNLYRAHLRALVEQGRVPMAQIDAAVARVLRLKFELGLFERPFTEENSLSGAAPNPEQLAFAEEFAARSLVLLKNDGALPVAPTARKIALLGPIANYSASLLGSWAQQGQPSETPTIADELRRRLPAGVELLLASGGGIEAGSDAEIAEAVAAAQAADIAVLVVGEEGWMSGENASRSSLRLAGRQEELALAVAATGKPVVLVLVSGRPLEIAALEPRVSAIVAAWSGGSRAAAALADVLLGRRNPSGKLAVTWPRTTGQIPLYHNMRPRARLSPSGEYRDGPSTPLYEFGHGLSYTQFSYGPIKLERPTVGLTGKLTAEVTVTNTGARDGVESVLWFIRDPAASITRPLRELKHFESAPIAAGTSRVFRFEIEPERDLSFPDADGRRILEPGEIVLHAGTEHVSFQIEAPKW